MQDHGSSRDSAAQELNPIHVVATESTEGEEPIQMSTLQLGASAALDVARTEAEGQVVKGREALEERRDSREHAEPLRRRDLGPQKLDVRVEHPVDVPAPVWKASVAKASSDDVPVGQAAKVEGRGGHSMDGLERARHGPTPSATGIDESPVDIE
jgi:hypothetical protein